MGFYENKLKINFDLNKLFIRFTHFHRKAQYRSKPMDGVIQFDHTNCQCLVINLEIYPWHIPAPLACPMGVTPRAVLRKGFNRWNQSSRLRPVPVFSQGCEWHHTLAKRDGCE